MQTETDYENFDISDNQDIEKNIDTENIEKNYNYNLTILNKY